MVRVKISSVKSLSTKNFSDKIQNCIDLMAGSPLWPNPSPPLQNIQNAIDTLNSLETLGQNGDRTILANKRTARGTLTALFLELCTFISFTVRNAPDAEELIVAIGLEPVKQGSNSPVATLPVPSDARSEVSQEPGGIDVAWDCDPRGVHSWIIEIADTADTANAEWRLLATSTVMKYKAVGLIRGKFYSFRIRCVGAKSAYSEPSETTTSMAG